jgi:hypothetical protein
MLWCLLTIDHCVLATIALLSVETVKLYSTVHNVFLVVRR